MKTVVVLGNGIVGLWTAYVLATRGHKVLIIAESTPYSTSSAAASSVISPMLPSDWLFTDPQFVRCWGQYRRTLDRLNTFGAIHGFLLKPERFDCYEFGFELDGIRYLEKGFDITRFDNLPFSDFNHIDIDQAIDVLNFSDDTHTVTFATKYIADFVYTKQFFVSMCSLLEKYEVSWAQERLRSIRDVVKYANSIVFNCLGYGSCRIFQDKSMYPVMGQSMFIERDRSGLALFGVASGNHAVFGHKRGVYIGSYFIEEGASWTLPRSHEYGLSLLFVEKTYPQLCQAIGIEVEEINLDEIDRVSVGVRPFRPTGPRIEAENIQVDGSGESLKIVHNYGHGAHGWTIGFGAAEDAVNLAEINGWLRAS